MVVAVAALIAAPSAAAATRYASPSGTGNPTVCSESNPCDIKTAVEDSSVQDDDVIVVLPGTYQLNADNLNIGNNGDVITVRSQPGAPRPRIVTSGYVSDYLGTLRRVKISSTSQFWGLLIDPDGTAERVTVDSLGDACTVYGDATIRDSVCWTHDKDNASAVYASNPDGASHSITLRNVTAVAAGSHNFGIAAVVGSTGGDSIDAKGVIASGTDFDTWAIAQSGGTAAIALDHSNYANRGSGGAGTTSITDPATNNNQTTEPVFADAAGGDFHQLFGSPTINAGDVDNLSGDMDIDDEPRTMDSVPDIGADELSLAEPNTTITKHPPKQTTTRSARFKFKADLAGSTFECNLDGTGYVPCSSPQVYLQLERRKHTFKVRADHYGVAETTPAKYGWTIER